MPDFQKKKKILVKIIFSYKKERLYQKNFFTHLKTTSVNFHRRKPRQMATENLAGEVVANSHGKFPWQVARTNSHGIS